MPLRDGVEMGGLGKATKHKTYNQRVLQTSSARNLHPPKKRVAKKSTAKKSTKKRPRRSGAAKSPKKRAAKKRAPSVQPAATPTPSPFGL